MEQIQQLAARHGFPEQFDLYRELAWRWEWWRGSVQEGPEPLGSERRRLLRAIARRAKDLEESLENAGGKETSLILEWCPYGPLDLQALLREVHKLAGAATVAARRVVPSKRGQHGDPETTELLCGLWRLYSHELAFGPNAPRLTRTDIYGGRFFDFAKDVLSLFGLPERSNNALGKAIEKALRAVDQRDAERNLSPD